MSHRRKTVALATLVAAGISTALISPATATLSNVIRDIAEVQGVAQPDVVTYTYAVNAPTPADSERLLKLGFDVLENREGKNLFVAGPEGTDKELAAKGFKATVREELTARWESPGGRIGNTEANPRVADTFFNGYHTAEGHINHVNQVAQARPDLAKKHVMGKSYTGKYDIPVLCITKINAGDCELRNDNPKPKFFLMTQTHAREIAAGEMAYRFIDHLTKSYDTDADVKNIMDHVEIWVLPIANPDGLDKVAQGGRPSMQRKNRNPTNGNCTGDRVGVDLNRNNGSNWGASGISKDPCADTYLGPKADSEPENYQLQNMWRQLFKAQRGNGGDTAAPATATGFMLSIHTVAGMNLVPWQYANRPTPNDKSLKAIGAQMKSFNGYETGQAPQVLYAASGGHDDWIYDKLGVAAATIELGGSGECGGSNFHPSYTACVDTYWKANLPVLLYLAKTSWSPYVATFGPKVTGVETKGITVSATIDAKTYANAAKNMNRLGNGNVAQAEYSFDAKFSNAKPLDLVIEGDQATARATVAPEGRSGRQMVYVRAKNAAGQYGPTTAAWMTF